MPLSLLLRIAAIGLISLAAAPAWSQGTLAGRVTETGTGIALPGVNILVEGTTRGTATDADGRYTVPGINPGVYTIQVSYIGFETKRFTGIRVRAGETTRLDIDIAEAVLSTDDEVVVVGDRPLVEIEAANSSQLTTRREIEAAPVQTVQDVVANQAGVTRDPTGLYIRGGRAQETGFVIDGVSAKDPLAGTGFGVELGSNSLESVEVTTGGVGAEHGDVTSGVVAVQTRSGTDTFSGSFLHKRDNLGFNDTWNSTFNDDRYEVSLGGPILPGRLRFFAAGQAQFSDTFTRDFAANDVQSSLVGDFWSPRQDNRWSGLGKLDWQIKQGMKLTGAYQRSIAVNQNTRSLQITGNEAVFGPGFQYGFALQPDQANTYTHDNLLGYVTFNHVPSTSSFYQLTASRLFTRLRADANGRDWRPTNVNQELDPESIVTDPIAIVAVPAVDGAEPQVVFVLPGPGLVNNGGLATLFHDHYAEQITLRGSYTRFFGDRNNSLTLGLDIDFNDYQWIDIERPWVGAPIGTGEDAVRTNRLGESSDIWQVNPRQGAFYASQKIRYKGLIATVGARFEGWQPGAYVDDLIENERAPILQQVRDGYRDGTVDILGNRTKFYFLPKLNVSFPVTDNRVLYFNYGHSTQLPHPTFVYAGLDPFYQDQSFFSDLGNPDLDPERDISYELGLKSQLTPNDVLEVTAFWRDKYDFITVENLVIPDPSGRDVTRAFRVNGDFARVRGLEATYIKRITQAFRGEINASYSRATGLSSTNNDAIQSFLANGDIQDTAEAPLAWDRPFDVKVSMLYDYNRSRPLFGIPGLNRFSAYLQGSFRSGTRYTPANFVGCQRDPITGQALADPAAAVSRDNCVWRPIYETDTDPQARFSQVGNPWLNFDLNLRRRIAVAGNDLVLTLEISNLLDSNRGLVINPVTGRAYPLLSEDADFTSLRGDRQYDVTLGRRDPRYEDPTTSGLPPFNPARYLPGRQFVFGVSYTF